MTSHIYTIARPWVLSLIDSKVNHASLTMFNTQDFDKTTLLLLSQPPQSIKTNNYPRIRDSWWGTISENKIVFELLANEDDVKVELIMLLHQISSDCIIVTINNLDESLWSDQCLIICNKDDDEPYVTVGYAPAHYLHL